MTNLEDRKQAPLDLSAVGGGLHAAGLTIDVAVCSDSGGRRVNADAVVEKRARQTGRTVVALADGIPDTDEGGRAAALAAEAAARSGTNGDPARAVLEAGDALTTAGARGDACLAVAVGPARGEFAWELAWTGNCRAYAFDDVSWRALRSDRERTGSDTAGSWSAGWRSVDVLTDTVRTSTGTGVDHCAVVSPSWLLLVTDGMYRGLGETGLRRALRTGATPADKVVALRHALDDAVLHDNATAVVIAGGRPGIRLEDHRIAAGVPVTT